MKKKKENEGKIVVHPIQKMEKEYYSLEKLQQGYQVVQNQATLFPTNTKDIDNFLRELMINKALKEGDKELFFAAINS